MKGLELKKLRIDAGLTRRALAAKVDCSINTIYQWEVSNNELKKIYEIALLTSIKEHSKTS